MHNAAVSNMVLQVMVCQFTTYYQVFHNLMSDNGNFADKWSTKFQKIHNRVGD